MSNILHAVTRYCYWLALLLLLILPASVVYMASVVRIGIPWGDDISILRDMRFDQGLKPSTLFKFSNEHQIFFTRITLFTDYLLFKGAHIFTTFVAVLLAFFIPLACAASFRFLDPKRPASNHLLLIGAFLLTVYCNGNILWSLTTPVLLQHLFTAAFAIVAGYAFSLLATDVRLGTTGPGSFRGKRLAAVFVSASALAAVSGANGLLIAPAALVVSILLFSDRSLFSRMAPWRLILPLLSWAIGLLVTYYFFYGATRLGAASGALQLPSLDQLVRFAVHFIGGPFWRESTWPMEVYPNRTLVLLMCTAFCALLISLLIGMLKRRRSLTAFEIFHFFLIVLVVLTAFAGAANRASLSAAEGLNKKYPPTSLLAWLAAFSLLASHYSHVLLAGNRKYCLRILGLSTTTVLLILPSHLIEFHVWRYWRDRLQETAAAVASGVFNEILVSRLYYDGNVAYDLMQNVFRPAESHFMRDFPPPPYPVTRRYQVAPGAPSLNARQVQLEEQRWRTDSYGYITTGTLPFTSELSSISSLVTVDAHGNVIGYGHLSTVSTTLRRLAFARGPPSDATWLAAFRPVADTPYVVIYGDNSTHLLEIARIPIGPTAN